MPDGQCGGNLPEPVPRPRYEIEITCPEFTAVCPKTGQPDFGTIVITYIPAATCIELKSLKLYLFGYPQPRDLLRASINTILDDLVAACQPRRMRSDRPVQPPRRDDLADHALYEKGGGNGGGGNRQDRLIEIESKARTLSRKAWNMRPGPGIVTLTTDFELSRGVGTWRR